MGKNLTHREILIRCDTFMRNLGWRKAPRKTLSSNGVTIVCDRIYIKEPEIPVAFEVKPDGASFNEIRKGIGQQACCLPYLLRPYFVISERQWLLLNEVLSHIDWLGVIIYLPNKQLRVVHRSKRVNWYNLKLIEDGFEGGTEHRSISVVRKSKE